MLSNFIRIGLRHLISKRKSGFSTLTLIAITGVTLGVAALLCVLAITSGFQKEFQNKVLGVNAHVLVMKYGLDFSEYPEIIRRINRKREITESAPFVVSEMMAVKGPKLAAILLKGIEPERSLRVLDLPKQMRSGSLGQLKRSPANVTSETHLRPNEPHQSPRPSIENPALAKSCVEGSNCFEQQDALNALLDRMGIARNPTTRHAHPAGPADAAVSFAAPSLSTASASLRTAPADLPSDQEEARFLEAEFGTATIETDPPSIILGIELADRLGARVGDIIQVVSPLPGLFANGIPSESFRVAGIFEAGFQEYDSRLAYVHIRDAQRFVGEGDSVTGIEIRTKDVNDAPKLARKLEVEFGATSPYHVVDWRQLNHNLFTALEIQKIMLTLVIATIVVVAAFNVIATLIMLVLEKQRDIAILKAMGSPNWGILSIFMVQGMVIGCLGIVLGLTIGSGLLHYLSHVRIPLDPKIYLINHLPVLVNPSNYGITSVVAFLICMFSTWVPSLWAARILPVTGLK